MKRKRTVAGRIGRVLLWLVLSPAILLLAACVLVMLPPVQEKAVSRATELLSEKTGLDISIGQLRLRPAVEVSLGDVLAREKGGGDTLMHAHSVLLDVDIRKLRDTVLDVNSFRIRDAVFDSRDLIGSVRISGSIGLFSASSDSTSINTGYTLIDNVRLSRSSVTILALEDAEPSATEQPFKWVFDLHGSAFDDISVDILPDVSVHLDKCAVNGSADPFNGRYDLRDFSVEGGKVKVAGLDFDIRTAVTSAALDGHSLDLHRLSADVNGIDLKAKADADLQELRFAGDLQASTKGASVSGSVGYAVKTGAFDADLDIDGLSLARFIPLDAVCETGGHIRAHGRGFDIFSPDTSMELHADLPYLRYDGARADSVRLKAFLSDTTLSGTLRTAASYADTSLAASAAGTVTFSMPVRDLSRPEMHIAARMDSIVLNTGKELFAIGASDIALETDRRRSRLSLVTEGLGLRAGTSRHIFDIGPGLEQVTGAFKDIKDIRTLDLEMMRETLPELSVSVDAGGRNPFSTLLDRSGISFGQAGAEVRLSRQEGLKCAGDIKDFRMDSISVERILFDAAQDGAALNLTADLRHRADSLLPETTARAVAVIGRDSSSVRLHAGSDMREGWAVIPDLRGNVTLDAEAKGDRIFEECLADGRVNIADLYYEDKDLGDRDATFTARKHKDGKVEMNARARNIPAMLAEHFIGRGDISLSGNAGADLAASYDGKDLTLTGNILPEGISVRYVPLNVPVRIGDKPVPFEDNKLIFRDHPLHAADNSTLLVNGVCDLGGSSIEMKASGKRIRPAELAACDSIPFNGYLLTDLDATVCGPFDSIAVKVGVRVLPETELTYHLDKTNYVHVLGSGDLTLDIVPGRDAEMKGRIDIDGGEVRYTLPYYPLLPFNIKRGSHVEFDGDPGNPFLDISASQMAKATVDNGLGSRNVDFEVGLQIRDKLDKLSLDFFLNAPDDPETQAGIDAFDDNERKRVAAGLLATGMYISSGNAALSNSGYALTSMLQARLNALSNNTLGKYVDVNLGVGEATRDGMTGTDYSLNLSRTFFDDRLKVSVGGRISDNRKSGGQNPVSPVIDNLSLEWKLSKARNTAVRLFHTIDYENVVDGELQKDGVGLSFEKQWKHSADGLDKSLGLAVDGNVSMRSNRQFGPDLSVTLSKKNLLGAGETLSGKLKGAYYFPFDKQDKDSIFRDRTYQMGAGLSLSFPSLVWPARNKPDYPASTVFSIGFLQENVTNGYRIGKFQASAAYRLQPNRFVTHSFSPFSVSLVRTLNVSEDYLIKILEHLELINSMFKDEYVPSVQYSFLYDDQGERSKAVTTRFAAGIKESGNLISGIQVLAGKDFNERYKDFIFKRYSQFTRFTLELRNNFRITDRSSIATRLFVGSTLSYGNSETSPSAETFYCGGSGSVRAFIPRSLGPGNFHSNGLDAPILHQGDTKLEMNAEYRFPLVWKFEGALFLDAGNVWNNRYSTSELPLDEEWGRTIMDAYRINYIPDERLRLKTMAEQIALGTGLGIRFRMDPVIIRLDAGIAIHCPYPTSRTGYYNIPNFWKDGVALNLAIGYPF